jgi:MFS family permease
VGSAGAIVGQLLGGVLTTAFGWRSIVLINVSIGMATIAAAARHLADSRSPTQPRLNVRGAALLTAGLAVVILTLTCVADGTSLTSVIVIAQLKAGPSSLSTSTIRVCSGRDVHTLDGWRSARCHSQPMTVPAAATDLGREP